MLIVDLGKSELEAEGLVKTVRADARYWVAVEGRRLSYYNTGVNIGI